ncbi:flagellin [Thioclava sediminum]|uniref:Flagellin n=1 Tax=Thioclava sediminum TaxID=1915319 RepID=A0ABX3N1I6_9RHOB|nr:flagellin [Thioclava sediminum]OOY24725.1 flagellin [Thioclava sediminum]
MSSILTNTGAMVALQTLKGINSGLATTQSEISTGKAVGSAKDNAAVWAISKVMESDVKSFSGISDSLALGESTVAVARKAAETVTDLLTDMKTKIVAAQEANVDRDKIQTDIDALQEQLTSVVGAAQFNGLNLVDGSSAATVKVLSSLDRASDGTVSASHIDVDAQNLSVGGYSAKAVFTASDGVSTDKDVAATTLAKADGTGEDLVLDDTVTWAAGDSVRVTLGDQTVSYTLSAADAAQTGTARTDLIAAGLKSAIDALGIANLQVDFTAGVSTTSDSTLTFKNDGIADLAGDLTIVSQFVNAGAGGLGAVASIDVTSDAGATAALSNIETLIQTATDAASSFGSVEGRIGTQADFISSLSDSLKAGIGSMIDADMEEASARLQALQTQQQLGIQALSIANQQPQNILSLFR